MGIHERSSMADDAVLICVARSHGEQWEGLCLDFNLVVQGTSLQEVRRQLDAAIKDYIMAASAEPEPARSQLLNRTAPLSVRLQWAWRFFRQTISGKNRDRDSTIEFTVACPA
jgi:hypothetical protein